MDCALTGGDEIEAREQHLNARAPLNCWEWDARPNLLERDGGYEVHTKSIAVNGSPSSKKEKEAIYRSSLAAIA